MEHESGSAIGKSARQRPALLVLLLVAALTWGDFVVRDLAPALQAPHWPNPGYWIAGRLALEGHADRIYADRATIAREAARLGTVPDIFEANMPLTVLAFLPIAGLSETAARSIWDLGMVACYILACAMLLRALALPAVAALGVWALVPLFHPWRENISRGQTYPLLLALLTFGWLGGLGGLGALEKSPTSSERITGGTRADLLAGAAFGLLAIVKLYYGALLILPALFVRRRLMLASAGALFALATLATLGLWGADPWMRAIRFAVTWRDRPETAVTAYQTLNSWLRHLLRYDATWNRGPIANLPGLVAWLWWVAAGALFAGTILVLWRVRNDRPRTRAQMLLAPSIAVPLALVIAPIAEDYHFVLALFPLLIAAAVLWELRETRLQSEADTAGVSRWTAGLIACGAAWLVAALLLGGPWRFNVPNVEGWSALLYYPRLYGALVLWAVLAGLLVIVRRQNRS